MGNPLAGVGSDVWATSTPSISTTNESCTDSGDHTTYTASVHIFWDFNATFTVQCSPNGSTGWATVTDYDMHWATGQIVFNTARTVGVNNFVRISVGNYFPATQLVDAHTWQLTTKGNTKPTTAFQSPGAWARHTATTKEGSGKIDTWRNDNRMITELNNLLGIQLFIDKTNNIRFQFYALAAQPDMKSDASSVQEQGLAFTCVKDVYLLTS
jgi:hypothetical protein